MDNHDKQHSTPEPIDFSLDEAPPVLPDPLPPVPPPTPRINALTLFPSEEFAGPTKKSQLRGKNINNQCLLQVTERKLRHLSRNARCTCG